MRAEAAFRVGEDRMLFHLRGPRTSGRRLWEVGERLLPQLRRWKVPFVVNDRVDLALLLGADGVHLGERSIGVREARALLGTGTLVGRSVHSAEGARGCLPPVAGSGVPDFLLAGNAFPTPSHPEGAGMGAEGLGAVVRSVPGLPVLAIGGIGPGAVAPILAVGGYGVAVMRTVWEAEDPGAVVQALLEEIGTARKEVA